MVRNDAPHPCSWRTAAETVAGREDVAAADAELAPIRQRAAEYAEDPTLAKNIIAEGSEHARDVAEETLDDVRQAIGLGYS